MLSCQRGLLELPWGGQQRRRKGAILWWFPWPSGPGGGSHVSRPELEPGPGVRVTATSPSLGHAGPKVGGPGEAGWGRPEKARLSVRTKLTCAVTGDSRLPVLLILSASHIREVLLSTGLLAGLWLGLISCSLWSV